MIDIKHVEEIIKKAELEEGLKKYNFIMAQFHKVNVLEDTSFQKMFRDFYQMRRFYSDEFASGYFAIMEELKKVSSVTFEDIFTRVKGIQGTYEISFASKMLHTFSPKMPIWDKIVTKDHFKIVAPYSGAKNRTKASCDRYQKYVNEFYKYMNSEEGRMIIQLFDQKFCNNEISDVKKLDFILWQDRKNKRF